ncbi:MAG TPA: outer membrane protein transport protein [Thermoanaerobaculia bacterium]|nr:outer membrane protein transport protein [Thermoanaerobaculia bacterium]
MRHLRFSIANITSIANVANIANIAGIAVVLATALLSPRPASAALFELFQHGGRATGQAGAFTARAADPSAVFYNPAAITKLQGTQVEAGLDFTNPQDEYRSATGNFKAHHVINFPPAAYVTHHFGNGSPVAVGLGLDSPYWNDLNWDDALFPGRFLDRRFRLEVVELHPVLGWEVTDDLSVGGGLRYLYGTLEQADNGLVQVFIPGGPLPAVEVQRDAETKVHKLAWDLAVHYVRPAWGWGAVFRSAAKLSGTGDATYEARDVPAIPGLAEALAARLTNGRASQSFELPDELRGGFWFAPYPELRVELDASYDRWSQVGDDVITYTPDAFRNGPSVRPRRWDNTLSLRLGVEGNVTDNFLLHGGFGIEPSPVSSGTIEPGFPQGDVKVYSFGFTYNLPQMSFDVGYSLHQGDARGATGQELLNPAVTSRYSARDQVWAGSLRWRF